MIAFFVALLVLIPLAIWFGFFTSADRSIFLQKRKTLEHDGIVRTYRVHVAKNKNKPKLIVGLDGFGGSGLRFAYYSALHNVVDDNTVIVYPDATSDKSKDYRTGWNSTYCCGAGLFNKVDDEGFLLALIDKMKQDYDVDGKQVFITGFSNGATMSHYMATNHPDIFAAVAPISGTIGVKEKRLNPTKPVPVFLVHGEKDPSIPFNGGITGDDKFFDWLPFSDTAAAWQKANGCDDAGENCKAEVKILTHPDLEHKWEGWRIGQLWRQKPTGSKRVIEFFDQH
ncbi:MAG: prolyl oligopeptidase family serine peptidase [bacterium]|nr:prolyl oligopeptidase family serine peptidase [bacterium]